MPVQLLKRLFTVAEYEQMATAGILGEDDRVELINGEIVTMTPVGSRHASAVKRLLHAFLPLQAAGTVLLSVQDPIQLGAHSEPQPDLALLRPRPDFYATAHPNPSDVLLIVEVAETSAEFDRTVKLPLYAKGGIPEVWLVNLTEDRIELFREPRADGYQTHQVVSKGQSIVPFAFPNFTIATDAILG
ncbi:MAG TPA: Uma2 family endonuclease [Patescibacteria group bacterium]|nr:Uma2 family endonuclease [Patescibacteria group bacterium]